MYGRTKVEMIITLLKTIQKDSRFILPLRLPAYLQSALMVRMITWAGLLG